MTWELRIVISRYLKTQAHWQFSGKQHYAVLWPVSQQYPKRTLRSYDNRELVLPSILECMRAWSRPSVFPSNPFGQNTAPQDCFRIDRRTTRSRSGHWAITTPPTNSQALLLQKHDVRELCPHPDHLRQGQVSCSPSGTRCLPQAGFRSLVFSLQPGTQERSRRQLPARPVVREYLTRPVSSTP